MDRSSNLKVSEIILLNSFFTEAVSGSISKYFFTSSNLSDVDVVKASNLLDTKTCTIFR